jgi:hypothetical protein
VLDAVKQRVAGWMVALGTPRAGGAAEVETQAQQRACAWRWRPRWSPRPTASTMRDALFAAERAVAVERAGRLSDLQAAATRYTALEERYMVALREVSEATQECERWAEISRLGGRKRRTRAAARPCPPCLRGPGSRGGVTAGNLAV